MGQSNSYRLAGAFLAAVAFLAAGAFLAGAAFLAAGAVRGAAGAAGHTPLASLGAMLGVITESLKPFSGVIRAFLDALMRMLAPVVGFRPMRAGRSTLENLAKPLSAT